MLAPEVKLHLRQSFALLLPHAGRFAGLFYEHLFLLAPTLRRLFPRGLEQQEKKLTDSIVWLIDNLDNEPLLVALLHQLGQRHQTYGVTLDDYAPVGSALIATLRHFLGPLFTDDMESAWVDFYTFLAQEMEHGANFALSPPAAHLHRLT